MNLSTPGRVNVLVSAWNDNIAGEARVLNPSPGRFVVGRASTNTKKAGSHAARTSDRAGQTPDRASRVPGDTQAVGQLHPAVRLPDQPRRLRTAPLTRSRSMEKRGGDTPSTKGMAGGLAALLGGHGRSSTSSSSRPARRPVCRSRGSPGRLRACWDPANAPPPRRTTRHGSEPARDAPATSGLN